jgi:hypothetical protein
MLLLLLLLFVPQLQLQFLPSRIALCNRTPRPL